MFIVSSSAYTVVRTCGIRLCEVVLVYRSRPYLYETHRVHSWFPTQQPRNVGVARSHPHNSVSFVLTLMPRSSYQLWLCWCTLFHSLTFARCSWLKVRYSVSISLAMREYVSLWIIGLPRGLISGGCDVKYQNQSCLLCTSKKYSIGRETKFNSCCLTFDPDFTPIAIFCFLEVA